MTAVGQVSEVWRFSFSLPVASQYIVEKGVIALDGVSLTVADVGEVSSASP